jgi:hypothetical protein
LRLWANWWPKYVIIYLPKDRKDQGGSRVSKEGGQSMEGWRRTTYQEQVKKVMWVLDINRDEVEIPMLMDIACNNDTILFHGINGIVQWNKMVSQYNTLNDHSE